MVRQKLIFGGVNSLDFGAFVSVHETFGAPQRDYEAVDVPGRNGALIIDNGRYIDVEMKYSLLFTNANALEWYRNEILKLKGYHRLEDTRHPEEYVMARVTDTSVEMAGYRDSQGKIEITFSRKPQRFLRSGERPIHFGATGATIRNPGMPSKPLIAITGKGAGTVTVGGVTVELKDTFAGLTLDCDTMDAYQLESNKNKDIKAATFPEIPSGDSTVSWTGGVTAVDITPRWWRL